MITGRTSSRDSSVKSLAPLIMRRPARSAAAFFLLRFLGVGAGGFDDAL